MLKSIKKRCITDDDTIEILLEDTRDGYITKNYLETLGSIFISKEGIIINPKLDPDEKIQMLKEKYLFEAFHEIFQEKDYEPLSDKYYNTIQIMITNGSLEALGYEIEKIESKTYETCEYNDLNHYKKR